jgi:uncharacterized membrane-anchored protein YhcB (DUF1043 family)
MLLIILLLVQIRNNNQIKQELEIAQMDIEIHNMYSSELERLNDKLTAAKFDLSKELDKCNTELILSNEQSQMWFEKLNRVTDQSNVDSLTYQIMNCDMKKETVERILLKNFIDKRAGE